MKLEEKLVSLRKAKGLSQLQLAEMLNVSRQAISRWEVGTAVPSVDNLKYLGRLYNVPLEYLLNDDALEPTPQAANNEAEPTGKRVNRRMLALAAAVIIAVIIAAVLICVVLLQKNQRDVVQITTIEGSEVETDSESGFDLEF